MKVDSRSFKGLSRFLAPSAGGPVGDRALAANLISPGQLEECLREQDRTGRPLDEILVERGYLKPEEAKGLRQAPLPPEVAEALADPLRHLSHYVLVSLLGAGGMSEVWKAWDRSLVRWVAVKLLRPDLGHSTERLEREGKLAGGLSHPNIITIYERGKHNGRPYLVMPFVDGRPPEPPLPPRQAARLAREVALALATVHRAGVIHRDVKPGNILVEADGGRVFLTDFGLAIPDRSASSRWSISGTPEYSSPEQIRGDPLDPRTDIYSLGATLYHLLSGRPPFQGRDSEEISEKVLSGEAPPLEAVPAALASAVRRAMARAPGDRYATVEEFERDLRRFLEGGRWKAIFRPLTLAALLLGGLVSSGVTYLILSAAARRDREVEILRALAEGNQALEVAEQLRADPQASPREVSVAAAKAVPLFNLAAGLAGGDDSRTNLGLGRCYELMGLGFRAEDAYRRAILLPEARARLLGMAVRPWLEGRSDRDWARWALSQAGVLETDELKALHAFFSGQWEDAEEVGGRALERRPAEAILQAAAGVAALKRGRWDRAAERLGRAARLTQDDPTILYWKALALEGRGDRGAAAEAMARALAVAPLGWALRGAAEAKVREWR